MNILSDEKGEHIVVALTKKEAQALAEACTVATEPKDTKPLRKNSAAYKLAYRLADEMPVW